MEKVPLTAKGFAKLDSELKKLKSVERPAIIAAIAEAREHGDLSENAEYHAARERQSFVEGRIRELEGLIGRSEVIDPSRLSGPIKFGATVVLIDEDNDEEKTYQIVGEQEASIENGLLNLKSPLARALIGKEPGDSVEVRTPGGVRSYEIRAVSFQCRRPRRARRWRGCAASATACGRCRAPGAGRRARASSGRWWCLATPPASSPSPPAGRAAIQTNTSGTVSVSRKNIASRNSVPRPCPPAATARKPAA